MSGNHTIKFGGDWRHNSDMLLQTQDNQGPARRLHVQRRADRVDRDTAANGGIANAFASFLLDRPSAMARDLKVLDNVGHAALGVLHLRPRQVAGVEAGDRRPRPALGVLRPDHRPRREGRLSNYDPATNTLRVSGYGSTPDDLGVKKDFNNFGPRLGVSFRLDDKTVMRAGFGASTTPFPDNRYAFNYPVKQNNSYSAPNSLLGGRLAWRPASRRRSTCTIPDNGIITGQHRAADEPVVQLRAERPAAGHALLLERRVPA